MPCARRLMCDRSQMQYICCDRKPYTSLELNDCDQPTVCLMCFNHLEDNFRFRSTCINFLFGKLNVQRLFSSVLVLVLALAFALFFCQLSTDTARLMLVYRGTSTLNETHTVPWESVGSNSLSGLPSLKAEIQHKLRKTL